MSWDGTYGLADLAVIGVRDAFGRTVTYTPSGGAAESITAIFDAAHEVLAIGGDGRPVSSGMTAPVIDVRLADVASGTVTEGDQFSVDGVDYEVVEEMPGTQGRSSRFRLVEM